MILILVPVLFVVGYVNAGGFTALSDVYEPRYLSFEPIWDLEDYGFAAILTWCFQNIMLYVAAPWYGQRVFSARTEKIAYRGMLANTVLITALYSLVAVTTMFSRVLMPDLEQPEEALPQLINDYLPAVMQGLMLVMLLLVGISTMVAIWNSAVSIVVNDSSKVLHANEATTITFGPAVRYSSSWASPLWPLPSLSSATFFWPLPMPRLHRSPGLPDSGGFVLKRFTTEAALGSLAVGNPRDSGACPVVPYHLISPVGVALSVVVGVIITFVTPDRSDDPVVRRFFTQARGEK